MILAGGTGSRFGGEVPKQFLPLAGRSVLSYSVEKFLKSGAEVVVVVHPEWMDFAKEKLSAPVSFVPGGKTRQESVRNGLLGLSAAGPDRVAVHDGARPLLSLKLIQKGFEACSDGTGAIPALRVNDTLCRTDEDRRILDYPDRAAMCAIQTPQFFPYPALLAAHEKCFQALRLGFTDDSGLFISEGGVCRVIGGEETNLKITTPADLEFAEFLVSRNPSLGLSF